MTLGKFKQSYSIKKAVGLNTVRNTLSRGISVSCLMNEKKQTSAPSNQPSSSDNSTYKTPEYYQYNTYSYFDIEKDMVKYRQAQPSSLPKIEYTWSQVPPTQQKRK